MGMAMARLSKLYQKQAKGRLNVAIPTPSLIRPKPDKVMQVSTGKKTYCFNFRWSDEHDDYINTQLNCTLAKYNKYRYK